MPGYLAGIAYTVVAAIVVSLLILLGWVLNRIARPDDQRPRQRREPAPRAGGAEVPA